MARFGRCRRIVQWALPAAALTIVFAPQVLAFPFEARVGGTSVYSVRPIPPAIGGVLARADALVAASRSPVPAAATASS